MGYTKNFEIWHGSYLGTLIMIQENQFEGPGEDHVLSIKGHILAISRKNRLWDTPRIVKFGIQHPWAH